MAVTVERLTCPGCGFPVEVGAKECPAGHPITISTFNNVNNMPLPLVNRYANSYRKDLSGNPDDRATNQAIGICYLKRKIYDKAIAAFEKAVEDNFDNSEPFFYAAICRLKGKKAFSASRPDIDKALEYLDAAIMIELKGIYYYFLAILSMIFSRENFLIQYQTTKTALGKQKAQDYRTLMFSTFMAF